MIGKIIASFAVGIALTGSALAAGKSESAPGQDRVCLITFSSPGTEANDAVLSTKMLPRKAAEAQQNDATRIYEYGPGGTQTAEACECLNDPSTRSACNQPLRTG